jgi:hypothetical protein
MSKQIGRLLAAAVFAIAAAGCGELPTEPQPLSSAAPGSAAHSIMASSTLLCGAAGTYCVNAAGPLYTDVAGNVFAADKPYTAGTYGSIGGINAYIKNAQISNTDDDELYKALKSADHTTGAPFQYLFDLPNGDYSVTLYFMEPTFGPGNARQRYFDVYMEGVLVLDDFNPGVVAGATRRALQVTVPVTVADGRLDIEFVEQSKEQYNTVPIVSALRVVTTTPPAPAPNIGVNPTSVNFGSAETGTTVDRTLTISNTGTSALDVSSLASSDAAFTVIGPGTPFTVAAGGSTPVTLRFTAGAIGAASGTLTIESNDPDEPAIQVQLSGTSTEPPAPRIQVTPLSVEFGEVTIGATANRAIEVRNLGTADLQVTGLSSSNAAFTVVSPAVPATVTPGNAVTVTVRFAPAAAQAESGELAISSNDAEAPTVAVSLAGTGTTAPVPPPAWRMNAGGPAYTAANGRAFDPDAAYAAGSFGFLSGSTNTVGGSVSGTQDPALYTTLRGATSFEFAADLPDGDYDVTLHFVEFYWKKAGERTFNVVIEGTTVLTNFDIFQAAGGWNRAVTRSFVVNMQDGQMNIDFVGVRRQAIVSAIEIVAR